MMRRFPFYAQHDSMLCGVSCLQMVCAHYGKKYAQDTVERLCAATKDGVSLLSISEAATALGMHSVKGHVTVEQLREASMPCIVHWEQNHFVVLYKIVKRHFHVADPGRGLLKYTEQDFRQGWVSGVTGGRDTGIALFLIPTPSFYSHKDDAGADGHRSFRFLFGYLRQYRRPLGQVALGLAVGCVLQLAFPFLTQAIVDVGVRDRDIGFIYLILAGQLMLVLSRTALDFIRRWLLLHVSMNVNISLVSDFFIKLLRLPMSFFDTKLTGDLLQRMADHRRVEQFLTTQVLGVMFSLLSFVVFGLVLLGYNRHVFLVFAAGSLCYAAWIALFLKRRKQIDYLYFERQARNNNKTYQFLTAMQEIKLQDCEQRRRWEWEDVQAGLFDAGMQSLRLQQAQTAGGIFINEVKNIVITVMTATAVIDGQMTLGMMLAVQYIIGQLGVPIEQLMQFVYSLQDVKISLERINEIHGRADEEDNPQALTTFRVGDRSLYVENFRSLFLFPFVT